MIKDWHFYQTSFDKKDNTTVMIQEIYTHNKFTLATFFSLSYHHFIDKTPEIKKFPNKKQNG
jgi:hypothetical protein